MALTPDGSTAYIAETGQYYVIADDVATKAQTTLPLPISPSRPLPERQRVESPSRPRLRRFSERGCDFAPQGRCCEMSLISPRFLRPKFRRADACPAEPTVKLLGVLPTTYGH